jgi:phosphatidylglycerophosphatase A
MNGVKRWWLGVATCCGLGYAPYAPGTVGAAAGIIPVYLLCGMPSLYLAVTVALFVIGLVASTKAEIYLDEHDSSKIVIDETASMMVTLFLHPFTVPVVCIGFVLNRLLDIVKPFPAYRAQNLAGGWGVMCDDLIAGIYGNLLLFLLRATGLI